MTGEQKSKLTFPCEFTFKIVGLADNHFEGEVLGLFRQHFPQLGEAAVSSKLSKNNKYLALTIKVKAISQAQLDATYRDLTANPAVLFAL